MDQPQREHASPVGDSQVGAGVWVWAVKTEALQLVAGVCCRTDGLAYPLPYPYPRPLPAGPATPAPRSAEGSGSAAPEQAAHSSPAEPA